MPKYLITIGKDTYEVESDRELSDAEAYQYAQEQVRTEFNSAAPSNGYADPRLQQTAQWDPATVPAGDTINPVPGATSPAPQNQNSNLDDESRRHLNRAAVQAATGPAGPSQSPYGAEVQAGVAVKQQIDELKAQRDALYRTRMAPVEKAKAIRALQNQIAALENQLPSDPYSTIGGTAGAVLGGVAGAAGGSALPGVGTTGGAVFGSVAGGFMGTLAGALAYANQKQMSDQEKTDYLFTKGIESIAYDTLGNIVFWGGGKVVGKVAKDTALGRWVVKQLGGAIKPQLKTAADAITPGERVFKGTTEAELRESAEAGARTVSSAGSTPSAGQLTGQPGLLEQGARAKNPGAFAASRRAQEDTLEGAVERATAKFKGQGAEFSGTDLRNALEGTEDAVKKHLAPTWDELRRMRGKDVEIVDFKEVRDWALDLLALNAKAKVKTLDGDQLKWLRKLAGGEPTEAGPKYTFAGAEVLEQKAADKAKKRMATISPGEAQDILSKMTAIARDAQSATAPNTEMAGFASKVASMLRGKLDDALASDPKFADARALYAEMMDVLYDPALAAARRGGESAAGRKALKIGEVEGVQALERLRALAAKVDGLTGTTRLSATAGAAHRGAVADFFEKNAGTPKALATLHEKMANPDFRKTFEAAIPDPRDRKLVETLSQAAQLVERAGLGGGISVEGAGTAAGRGVGAVVGMPHTGAVAGRLLSVLVSKDGAKAFTTPELRAELPRVTGWLLHAARGSGRHWNAEPPQFIKDYLAQLEAQ